MGVMVQVAEYTLDRDPRRHIVVDGRTFSRRYQLAVWEELGARRSVPTKVIECVCAEETVRLRLEHDVATGRHPAADRNYAMYLSVKERFEAIPVPKLRVNTDEGLESCVRRALQYLRGDR